MILQFLKLILLQVHVLYIFANWRLVDYSFTETEISNVNYWIMKDSCTTPIDLLPPKTGICASNNLEYVKLIENWPYLHKYYFQKSFQVQVILDVFFIEGESYSSRFEVIYDSSFGEQQVIYSREYCRNDLIQDSDHICKTDLRQLELYTIVSSIANFNNNSFKIQICFNPRSSDMQIGIRNMLIYINTCYPTCLTCNGPLETNCLTCYGGQSVVSGKCICISSQQFSETQVGCLLECKRDYSIARFDKVCVEDNRIQSIFTLFENSTIPESDQFRYYPFNFLTDIFHPKNTDLIQEDCSGINFIGKLQFSEGMLYQMNLQQSVKFLRMRITFYLCNFQDASKIEILHNNQTLSRIVKDTSGFQYENLINILQINTNCQGSSYTLLRIEVTFQLLNQNPIIILQGQLQYVSEFWGFRNVTIDSGFCQEFCKICTDNSKCAVCESGYQLYKNKCVRNCPIHSTNCVDYEDIIQYSRYIAKGFYNLNMTIQDINSFYDTTTDPSNKNFATGQKFSFLNNKIVLGGLLVWNQGSYIKTWTIQKPHYAVSIYFNLTYGDGYYGQFFYKIGSTSQGPFSNPGGGSNLIGNSQLESNRFFYVHLDNFYDNHLEIEFRCEKSVLNILSQFCAISDYFIVAHYCPPFCRSCSSLIACTDWEYGYMGCGSHEYLYFNEQTENYACNNCDQSGCNTCVSAEDCTSCISDQFQLYNGICQCKPFTILQGNVCVQCNKYCEHCYGTFKYNCLSCVQEFHRSIQRNQCLCQPGYYDDEINLPCLPKCGDQIIVDEEDCDDGNNDPFDGCHQCQFTCQEECQLCFKGKCYQCKDNYQLIEAINTCNTICGDLVRIKNEQCDDGNDNIFDGCHLCQFQCYNHCVHCNQGICYKCDEINGWYLIGARCEFKCGDGIVAKGQEQCDDSNLNPFDLCNFCKEECQEHCIFCQNGECLRCETGFKFDYQNSQCSQICGDNLIVGNEQCEDQITNYLQICEDCQFKCHHNCQLCNYDKCLLCEFGYSLINNGCEQVCGDGQIVGTEVCDTLYQDINSNCFNCYYNCGDSCLVCNQGICEICKIGYLLEQYSCVPICGDLIIVEPELCDDGNLIPYDGCYTCTYSCEFECNVCQFGKCLQIPKPDVEDNDNNQTNSDCIPDCNLCDIQNKCLACNEHFQLINNSCASICGDGIVIEGLEECDDGNDQPDDGCYNCQFQCSEGCVECRQNQCTICNDKFYILDIQTQKCLQLNSDQNEENIDLPIIEFQQYTILRCGDNQLLINNICVNQCGNGLQVNQYEECDDGNIFGGDGCSSFCNMEDSYQCINQQDSLSLCTYIQAPDFKLDTLSDKASSIQLLELTFTQQVKVQTELVIEDILQFSIFPQTQYHLTINTIDNITIYLGYPKYQIYIEFIQSIQDPILQIDIQKSIIHNEFNQDLQIHQRKIILGTPFVLPETTKQQLTSVVQINDVMMYSMVSISSLALLTGNAIMFFNLLDLLQSLSYIKFMQYQFPPHLIEFLNTYTKVSLQPIMNYFQVDQLLAKLNGGTFPNQITNKSNKKISKNALNECYLVNAKSCYFSALASIITYLLNTLLVSKSFQSFVLKFYIRNRHNYKLVKLIDLLQEKIQKKCLQLKIEYFSFGIFKVYQAILHQLLFSTLLQFPNYQFNNTFEIFNSINAIFGLLFILMATFPLFTITTAPIKDLRKWKYFYYESKTQFWSAQCRSFQIYRILFYIIIIVQFINYPEAQSILLSMLSLMYLIYLIRFKPLQSSFELFKLICRELLIMIITGTFLIYSFEFSQDNLTLIGWIHIGMFCTILASNLFIDIFAQVRKIYDNHLQKKYKQQLEQEQKYYFNHLQGFFVHDYDNQQYK